MKRIFRFIIAPILLCCAGSLSAQQTPETYFPYPMIPDSIQSLQGRCDYLVDHFWDFCDLKKAFSSRQKMAQAFADYISFMPHASARHVHNSINVFLKKIEKQPQDLLFIAEEAEAQLLGDSAQFVSTEVFLPFAKAVADNKKLDRTTKMRYERLARILEGTQVGAVAPDLVYTDREGRRQHLANDTAEVVIIFFSDPSCSDCSLARVRLDADIRATQLIDAGVLKVVALTPDDPSEEWREAVARYPATWSVGAAPDAYDIYDIKEIPSFYILDDNRKIAIKNITINQLLQVLSRL
ncbi:MAG: DUF5106 domain-containing protein [Clostridium sp.]|nr:DUF5106 domain-containing protein [Clostridium sp.]